MHPRPPESDFDLPVDPDADPNAEVESPHHGFQGDRGEVPEVPSFPLGLTLAVSREAGARGGTIARRVGRMLDWQVYNQEMLEYMAQETEAGRSPLQGEPSGLVEWVESRLEELLREQSLSQHPSIVNLARVILTLGAHGNVVLVGRGAGFLLPRESRLHVRVIAPREDRIHYFSQWRRLTLEEAALEMEQINARRAEYISTHFHEQAEKLHQYELLLNSSYLGEHVCAELLVSAVKSFQKRMPRREDMKEE